MSIVESKTQKLGREKRQIVQDVVDDICPYLLPRGLQRAVSPKSLRKKRLNYRIHVNWKKTSFSRKTRESSFRFRTYNGLKNWS